MSLEEIGSNETQEQLEELEDTVSEQGDSIDDLDNRVGDNKSDISDVEQEIDDRSEIHFSSSQPSMDDGDLWVDTS